MNKYIIELDENAKEVVVISLEDGDMWTETMEVEDLEQLNSDYINEHFSDLQDTAYQRGLDDAWEAARKIADMWTRIDNDELLAIFGITERIGHSTIRSLFEKQTASEAIEKLKAYEEKQKADDEIKVGDTVNLKDGSRDNDGIVTKSWDNDRYFIMWADGAGGVWDKEYIVKTGRHFDIQKILEEMKK